jgi:hypothetical protein
MNPVSRVWLPHTLRKLIQPGDAKHPPDDKDWGCSTTLAGLITRLPQLRVNSLAEAIRSDNRLIGVDRVERGRDQSFVNCLGGADQARRKRAQLKQGFNRIWAEQ